jgi:uncharacterized OB-fold protein
MTPEQQHAFEAKIQAYVGREVCARKPAPDPVSAAMIRHWAEVMGDSNPAYQDGDWAAQSRRGHPIAPPAMLYVWNQEGYAVAAQGRPKDPLIELVELFNTNGYTGVLGTNLRQEYAREARLGDVVHMEMLIESVSERKTTARGVGYFVETLATFTDQAGDTLGTQRFRILKFQPHEQTGAAAVKPELQLPTRIASPRGHDNAWWWEACDEGRILIQRCRQCGTLRHPPRPMCGDCQSMDWDSIESSLEGEVLSYTEVHHPKVPGYSYPLLCAVIRLDEGTNIVANLSGCEDAIVSIGMRVRGRVEAVDEKTVLPQFYPLTNDTGDDAA